MLPRPFHRWKSFWLGLFVLGFLSWAWWDSLGTDTRVTHAGPNTAWQVSRMDGHTAFVAGRPAIIAKIPGWSFHREKKRRSMAELTNDWRRSRHADVRYFTIPDIIIVVPCFAAWLNWIAWRMWRSQRLETRDLASR
ncbi:hypothetical protein OKA05_20695 [Luteolibacter arcticus]|uniref:Uncharacterized protein n=1 Tax=Luteolibacter arcticus TaxID=1581411 RepID=A0ABT3GNA8_9BACT|nr:hypothetical protein [Luteolibacter arcticus]MCW1924994.1 hypothetical protein [Luteolibacter arcticus]